METLKYYCWDGDTNNVRSWDGDICLDFDYLPSNNTGNVNVRRFKHQPDVRWQPSTREVFEATRAKVMKLLKE